MLKKLLCLFAIVVLYPDGADAQKTYTLDDAVKTAIANDPVIKNFKNNLEIQKLNISTSKGSLLPTLSLTGNYTRSHVFTESGVTIIQGVPITRPRQDITRNNFNFSLNSDVVLFDGFANTRKIDLAEEQVDVLKFNLENAKNNIVLSVNQKFFQVLKSEQIVKQNEENLADSKAQLDKIKEIVNVGRGTIGDVYRQDVQVAQNELALERAKNDLRKSKVDLQAAMYDEIGKDINVAQGDIKSDYETAELEMILRGIGTLDELSDIALKNRYDYKAGLKEIELNKINVDIYKKNFIFPTLSAFGSYNLNSTSIGEIFDNRTASYGLTLSYPIFQGFSLDNNVQIAEVQVKVKEEEIRELEQSIRSNIQKSLLDLETAFKQIEIIDRNIVSAEQDKLLADESYRIGIGTLLDAQIATTSLNNLRIERINAVYNFLIAKRVLDYYTGILKY
ncbi:MAG: TolC family protein [Ignavibacteriaceae bacterium]|jgi:Outer membrane protein|nr:MAG: TolC family protein [Chlorobiota bacterium]KXK04584.1 MAG: Outer membrane protein TolC [Chlorobi bacterium OLB4]MBV6399406.1 Outer membrane efflux protein BepC [Ignavibacteria bacterium]MCC6886603.1 TolC family protein [Ignavibacteriales bacterium]MCE7953259.1 TolC family protein [Chlorobi bacterium CHB7]MDL1887952.1 TolC family protein [Ignavibacteria bacterium CHB1]MEB2328959.1 TolC family protein [Ignavibacteriaceae bacterium]OQY76494.1 MAG: hypothetical protein B6D43_09965 [Ignav